MSNENAHKLWHRRGYLPHFDQGATTQMITFRLADSLPLAFHERLASMKAAERSRHVEAQIDKGRGSCILADPTSARIVQDALEHFDGNRYRLIAWVVMPNHVHVLVEQISGHRLGDSARSWKNFTARKINACRGATGAVWSPDYFDRFIRNAAHLENAIRYVEENPAKAGLVGNAADWPFSSCRRRLTSDACLISILHHADEPQY